MHIIQKIFDYLKLSLGQNLRRNIWFKTNSARAHTIGEKKETMNAAYKHLLLKAGSIEIRKSIFIFCFVKSTVCKIKFELLLFAFLTEGQYFIWKMSSVFYLGPNLPRVHIVILQKCAYIKLTILNESSTYYIA